MRRIFLLVILIAIIGCGDDDENPIVTQLMNGDCLNSNPDCEIIPLAVGNSWVWEEIYYNSSGTEIGRDTLDDQVTRDSVVNSEVWYFIPPVWFCNRADGIWYLDLSQGLWYKYPAGVGDQYGGSPASPNTEVLDVDKRVTLDLGIFSCYEYLILGATRDTSFAYVAPGVGIVKYMHYAYLNDSANYLSSARSLIQYNLE
jgi:hypothetical protein